MSKSNATGVIYRIYNKVNGKSYIGATTLFETRIQEHFRRSSNSGLNADIQKYGRGAFGVDKLEVDVPESLLDAREMHYINQFNSKAPSGYNLTSGGKGMLDPAPELRQKLSEMRSGENNSQYGVSRDPWNKGKTNIFSEEARKKIANANLNNIPWNKGKTGVYSPEHLQHMSDVRSGENHHNYGKPRPLETRQKIASTLRSPEYELGYAHYLTLPADMCLREKRKSLRSQFPNKDWKTIWNWVHQWESERNQ